MDLSDQSDDLAPVAGAQRQHHFRSALQAADGVRLERGSLRQEELGLTLAEVKRLLHGMQQSVVTEHVAEYLEKFTTYPDCGAHRTCKGQHPIAYWTVFGKFNLVSLPSLRLLLPKPRPP